MFVKLTCPTTGQTFWANLRHVTSIRRSKTDYLSDKGHAVTAHTKLQYVDGNFNVAVETPDAIMKMAGK